MPAEAGLAGGSWRRVAMDAVAEMGIGLGWLWFGRLDYAVACHRWAGWRFALSIAVSCAAALAGWCLVRRAAARFDDARLGDLLAQVEDAPGWALFPHPVQTIKWEHTARCRERWGVTPRTSGWLLFRRSWRAEVASALGCLVLVLHAGWLGA